MRTGRRFSDRMVFVFSLATLVSVSCIAPAVATGTTPGPGSGAGCPVGEAWAAAPDPVSSTDKREIGPSAIGASTGPRAADETGPRLGSIVEGLLTWIDGRTAYDVSAVREAPPAIVFVNEGTRIAYEGRMLDIGPTLAATYDAYAREIHLKCPWDAADPHDVSTLLHELVHDVQYRSRLWACPRQAEWEAYALQADWLEERGARPQRNWLQAVLSSGCLRDVHP